MARLLDPNDDLKDVIGPEAVKFAKDQGWVLTKTGQTRDGAVNSIVRAIPNVVDDFSMVDVSRFIVSSATPPDSLPKGTLPLWRSSKPEVSSSCFRETRSRSFSFNLHHPTDPTIARFLDSTDDLEEIVKPRIESYRRKHDIFTDWRMMTLTKPKVVAESVRVP